MSSLLLYPRHPLPPPTLLSLCPSPLCCLFWETHFYGLFPWICLLSAFWLTLPMGGMGRISENERRVRWRYLLLWFPYCHELTPFSYKPPFSCLMAFPYSSSLWILLHYPECVWLPPPSRLICTCMLNRFTRVWLFVILWIVDCQAPLSMGSSQQEY